PAVRFGVLGPITAWTDAGEEVPIRGVKVRAVLADLVVHGGEAVTADRLVDDVWGESPGSRNPAGTLSSKVSQLRRAFEAAEPGAAAVSAAELRARRRPGRSRLRPDHPAARRGPCGERLGGRGLHAHPGARPLAGAVLLGVRQRALCPGRCSPAGVEAPHRPRA